MAPMSDPNATPPGPPAPPAPPVPPVPPVPQYGEYAPAGYVAPQPVAGPPQPMPTESQPFGAASYPQQPAARKRKTWDVVLTIILLVMGFFGMLAGVALRGALLRSRAPRRDARRRRDYGGFNGDVGAAPAVLIISHVVLYLIALGSRIPLLITRRVAFWLPLAAGVIAADHLLGRRSRRVVLSDPSFVAAAH